MQFLFPFLLQTFFLSTQTINASAADVDAGEELLDDEGGVAIGIDLGTTYSCVFIYDKARATCNNLMAGGQKTFPSVLTYEYSLKTEKNAKKGGEDVKKIQYLPLTGHAALAKQAKNPDGNNYFYAFKRLMGLSQVDIANTPSLKGLDKKVSYKLENVQTGKSGHYVMVLSHPHPDPKKNKVIVKKKISAVEASKEILKALHAAVIAYGKKVESIIVTTPAYFNENQVKATSDAALAAGIKLTRTMNEPVAAAWAYHSHRPDAEETTQVVFDMGGGTLDISLIEYEDKVMEVKTYSGDNFLGGENINDSIQVYFESVLKNNKNFNQKDNSQRLRLKNLVEEIKIELCTKQNEEKNPTVISSVTKDYFIGDEAIPLTLNTTKFNQICEPVFRRVKECLVGKNEGILNKYKSMGGKVSDIKKVLFVGGSSRIPYIRKLCKETFPSAKMCHELNPDTCVAEGAAFYAATLAGMITEDERLSLVDSIPMSIGICVNEDEFHPLIEKNATIPAKNSQVFTTAYDMQKKVSIRVAQGGRYSFKANHYIGDIELDIDEPMPRGLPKIEVELRYNSDRTVTVNANNQKTGKASNFTFERSASDLSPDDIKKALEEAEAHKEEDEALRERYESLRKLEEYIETAKKRVANAKDVDKESKKEKLKTLGAASTWLTSERETADKMDFDEKFEELKNEIEEFLGQSGNKDEVYEEAMPDEKEEAREDL